MKVRVVDLDLFVTDCNTRLPFRFGAVTLRQASLALARVTIESDAGGRHEGFASDLMVPKWFEKDPEKSLREDAETLLASAQAAARTMVAGGSEAASVFDHWWRVYSECGGTLVRGFGVALAERALLDATCRAAQRSFFEALREDLFGFRPEVVLPELAGWTLSASLPESPAASVRLRHTVGMADPLRVADVPAESRLSDGFPQALEEDVAAYGLDVFKVKIGSGHDSDRNRLLDLAAFFEDTRGSIPEITLDGNEQFEDLADLVALLREVGMHPEGARLLEKLLTIEQPLHRTATFDPERNRAMPELAEIAPVILDEADGSVDSFPRALELGYRGISVKNCKGVFRTLVNRGLCEVRGDGAFQSAEDLTNLPVLPLQQDLATVAALGLPHVERNGHHYFRGLDHLPAPERDAALAAHPDLYRRLDDGTVALRVEAGRLQLGSLQTAGYGCSLAPDPARRIPATDWMAGNA